MANKELKYRGITFNVILPKDIPETVTGRGLFNEFLDEDQIALMLACESDSAEIKLRDDSEKIVAHIEYTIDAKEYEKSLGCDAEVSNDEVEQ